MNSRPMGYKGATFHRYVLDMMSVEAITDLFLQSVGRSSPQDSNKSRSRHLTVSRTSCAKANRTPPSFNKSANRWTICRRRLHERRRHGVLFDLRRQIRSTSHNMCLRIRLHLFTGRELYRKAHRTRIALHGQLRTQHQWMPVFRHYR